MKVKEKNTENKGITLVALVITIIILLILAGVAINLAIDSNGLFGKANEAVSKWNQKVKQEEEAVQNLLSGLNEILINNSAGNIEDDTEYVTVTLKKRKHFIWYGSFLLFRR